MLGGGPGVLGDLLRQAQELQGHLQDAQDEAAAREVVGSAGGGVVKVTATGALEFRSVEISPEVVDPDDVGMLEDLVLAAIHDATERARRLTQDLLGEAAPPGGFDLPGIPGMPGVPGMPGLPGAGGLTDRDQPGGALPDDRA